MLTYVLKRVGQTVLTAFLAVATVFVLLRMAPGDPAANYAPPNPSSEQLEAIRVQFWTFLQHLFQGDVGTSFFFKRPALDVVLERLPYTITLAVAAIVVTSVVAIPLGVWMARRNNTAPELGANIGTIAGQSMPDFWIGFVLLILFAVQLQWFAPAGFDSLASIVLPTLTVAILQI